MSEVIEAVADASQNTAENSNISASEFELRRARQMEGSIPSKSEPEAEDASISENIETESQSNEEEVSEGNEDVLSNIDLENLSEEQIKHLSEALSSRAVGRFGKLTARAKAAEEKAQTLEQSLKSQQEQQVLSSTSEIENNPYQDLKSVQNIQDKAKEINDVIEWAEDVLFESADYGPEDEVTESNGQSMTKLQVREALKQARKSRDKYLPDQFRKVKNVEDATKLRQQYGQKAIKEFKWLGDKKSEQTKQFVQLASQPALQKAYEQNPDLSWQLPYLLAHSVNSMFGEQGTSSAKTNAGEAFKPSPPKSPSLGGAKSDKSESNSSKALKDLSSRFRESGNKDDFQKMREARWSRHLT
tara:strand:- start:925 stop:2001 length:1077 start_codon:yes stop_codon:yes gene_type:complete